MKRQFDVGREILKLIAIITMSIDHIGAILYPEYVILRVIGRLAFPLFAYLLVLGVESTRNVRNYFMRLLIFAFISQVPFYLALGLEPFESLNVFFTLACGVLFVCFCKKKSLLALLPFFASVFLNFDYGVYGIALIGCMYILLEEDERIGILLTVSLNLLFLPVGSYQMFSLLALPIILLHKNGYLRIEKVTGGKTAYPTLRKYLYYIYYPAHLMLLYLINLNY